MLKLFVLSCLLAQAFAGKHLLLRGDASRSNERITGGTTTKITKVPFQVGLLLDYLGNRTYTIACSGSIISESVILTAAHCYDDTSVNAWQVRAGSTFTDSGGQLSYIARNVFPDQYGDLYRDYDIALSFLTIPIIIDNILTTPVKLPEQDYTIPENTPVLLTGWGALETLGSTMNTLRKITIPISDQEECIENLNHVVTERMICAGEKSIGGRGACRGDGGSPLSIDGVVIGITSWSYPCERPYSPGVFTKVSAFRNWIDSHM